MFFGNTLRFLMEEEVRHVSESPEMPLEREAPGTCKRNGSTEPSLVDALEPPFGKTERSCGSPMTLANDSPSC